jgi:hypothetical protein
VLLEHFKLDLGDTTGGETQNGGGPMGQVDDPTAMEGTAIIDPDHG